MWFPCMIADDLTFADSFDSGNLKFSSGPKPCSRNNRNPALMNLSPLDEVLKGVNLVHKLEQRVKLDADDFKGRIVTPEHRANVERQLERFQQTINILTERKSLPQFGTYTFQRMFDALIAALKDLSEFVNTSLNVPPLYAIEYPQ